MRSGTFSTSGAVVRRLAWLLMPFGLAVACGGEAGGDGDASGGATVDGSESGGGGGAAAGGTSADGSQTGGSQTGGSDSGGSDGGAEAGGAGGVSSGATSSGGEGGNEATGGAGAWGGTAGATGDGACFSEEGCLGGCEGTCEDGFVCDPNVICGQAFTTFCGCDGVTFTSPSTCPNRAARHQGACEEAPSDNCDERDILCLPIVPPEKCPAGEVHSVVDSCHGPCVPIAECACLTADDCPDPNGTNEYTCLASEGHCSPWL